MVSQGFSEIDHTGDLALRVWGKDFQDLLRQAARGFYHLLNVNTIDGSRVSESFSIDLVEREAMLVDFLNELLYLCEERQEIFHRFSFNNNGHQLIVKAQGEKAALIVRHIKAVTFHDLNIIDHRDRLETIVTFDV